MKYAALLRGIGPMNPNMRNEKLRGVFENLGFRNVQSVISSGNVLFETDAEDAAALERRIEQALPYVVKDRKYSVLGVHGRAIFSIVNLTGAKTPDLMAWLEKTFGKDITTRTWKTVGRILTKLDPDAMTPRVKHPSSLRQ